MSDSRWESVSVALIERMRSVRRARGSEVVFCSFICSFARCHSHSLSLTLTLASNRGRSWLQDGRPLHRCSRGQHTSHQEPDRCQGQRQLSRRCTPSSLHRWRAHARHSRSRTARPTQQSLRTPLHFAAANGQFQAAKKLLQLGADVNALRSQRVSPVFQAAGSGHEKVRATHAPSLAPSPSLIRSLGWSREWCYTDCTTVGLQEWRYRARTRGLSVASGCV